MSPVGKDNNNNDKLEKVKYWIMIFIILVVHRLLWYK